MADPIAYGLGNHTPQSELSRVQILWESRMRHPSRAIRHDKTSVLLLSWEPDHDDLGVRPEVDRLKEVFIDSYGFRVRDMQLNTRKKPEHQAAAHMTQFVLDEDSERGLLIIYYAGHGHSDAELKSGDIKLIGRLEPASSPEAEQAEKEQLEKNSIVWSNVEGAIRNTEADILLIFDCCKAGRLGRPLTRAVPTNSYEFLGACAQTETTRGPGKESFTSALIWTLSQFAKKEEVFSTSALLSEIMEYEHFPKDLQTPVLFPRRVGGVGGEHIVISHKNIKPGSTRMAPSKSERAEELMKREYLDVRLHFDFKITNEHVQETADALKHLMDVKKVGWNRASLQDKYTMAERTAYITQLWKDKVSRSRTLSSVSPSTVTVHFPVTQVGSHRSASSAVPATDTEMLAQSSASAGLEEITLPGTIDPQLAPLLPSCSPISEPSAFGHPNRVTITRTYDDESIVYHMAAIGHKVLALATRVNQWLKIRVGMSNLLCIFKQA